MNAQQLDYIPSAHTWRPSRWQVGIAFASVLVVVWVGWCVLTFDPFRGRGVLLDVADGPARVWLLDNGSFDMTLELHVVRRGQHQRAYVIDKSNYSTLRFIRFDGNILVANGDFVFAAYDASADRIVSYDQLPFTVWEGQGEVVDSYQFSNDPASMRPGFPRVREQSAEDGGVGGPESGR